MPKPPPPLELTIPADLRIAVDLDGTAAPPITAANLASIPPDFIDKEHRAWRISTLVGAAAGRPGVVVAATGARGISIKMPIAGSGPVPALVVTRRGEVIATLVDPADPFPDFHGRGRRLGRPGDSLPRVAGVSAIHVTDQP